MALDKDVVRNKGIKIPAKYFLIKCLLTLNDFEPSLTIIIYHSKVSGFVLSKDRTFGGWKLSGRKYPHRDAEASLQRIFNYSAGKVSGKRKGVFRGAHSMSLLIYVTCKHLLRNQL